MKPSSQPGSVATGGTVEPGLVCKEGEVSAAAELPEKGGLIRVCHYCKEERAWIDSGRKLKDGSRIYVDAFGSRWAGRRCPACEKARVYEAVRCDQFERELICRQLQEQGYEARSSRLPLKVMQNGEERAVTIRRAYMSQGEVVVDGPVDETQPDELVALVFESVRIVTKDQLERMRGQIRVYESASPEAARDKAKG